MGSPASEGNRAGVFVPCPDQTVTETHRSRRPRSPSLSLAASRTHLTPGMPAAALASLHSSGPTLASATLSHAALSALALALALALAPRPADACWRTLDAALSHAARA